MYNVISKYLFVFNGKKVQLVDEGGLELELSTPKIVGIDIFIIILPLAIYFINFYLNSLNKQLQVGIGCMVFFGTYSLVVKYNQLNTHLRPYHKKDMFLYHILKFLLRGFIFGVILSLNSYLKGFEIKIYIYGFLFSYFLAAIIYLFEIIMKFPNKDENTVEKSKL